MSEVENAKQKLSLALKNLQEKVNTHMESYNLVLKKVNELQSENSLLKQQIDFFQNQKSAQQENITKSEDVHNKMNYDTDNEKTIAQEDVDLSINQLKGLLKKDQ